MSERWRILFTRRMIVTLLLGFSSGLPVALVGVTLQAWLTVREVNITTIGTFSLLGLPYVVKFLWAPLMDRFTPPFLGRRRGWILVTQLGLLLTIVLMGGLRAADQLGWVAIIGVSIAFLSASQDIVIDAYRTDSLPQEEYGLGTALYVWGYRLSGLLSGGVALVLADAVSWEWAYSVMAALMAVGIFATLLGQEPKEVHVPTTLQAAVVEPFQEFFARPGALLLLLCIVLYKVGDAFAGHMTTPFLLRGVHFSLSEVGATKKLLEVVGTCGGVFIGGWLLLRLSLYRALMLFGILQAASNVLFTLLAVAGHVYGLMVLAIFTENLCGGMGTAGFVAFLMQLCDHRFTATQYALLSALALVGRTFIGPLSGILVEKLGWPSFFLVTVILALPGLGVLWWVRGTIDSYALKKKSATHDTV